ncbi:MAG: hypothetical protein IH612_04835 [Desulfofustis sp.]|nr:hypothetical protein [Desulfofustis sp.]
MHKLRVCIGSADGETIAKTHFGDTEFFYIYDLAEGSGSTFIGQRLNMARDMDHAQTDKMKKILDLLNDVDILVAQQKSPNFIKIASQTKYQPVVVRAERMQQIVILLQNEFKRLYSFVERRKSGETFELIPELQ